MHSHVKEAITKSIQDLHAAGKTDAEAIERAVEQAVSEAMQNVEGEREHVRGFAKDAMTGAVSALKTVGAETQENIEGVVEGTLKGIGKSSREMMQNLDMELLRTKYRLEEQKGVLAAALKEAFDGAKDAAETFSGETTDKIKDAATTLKLKNAELLGLMEETVRQSVQSVLLEGKDIRKNVSNITQNAMENALNTGRLSTQRVKALSESVLLAAIETAEATGKNVKETAQGAVDGTKKAIAGSIDATKTKLANAKAQTLDAAKEDLEQTLEDLQFFEEMFIETLSKTADEVGDAAQEVLLVSIDEMKHRSSQIKEKAQTATRAILEHLKEERIDFTQKAQKQARETAKLAKEEAADLADKMLKITRGAFSGMIEGAKKALKSDEEKE